MEYPNQNQRQASSTSTSNSSGKQKWKAQASFERKKLASSPSCKLAGSDGSVLSNRTRGVRVPLTRLDRRNDDSSTVCSFIIGGSTSSPPSELVVVGNGGGEVSTLSSSVSPSKRRAKPPDDRVIIQTSSLSELMERHMLCPLCRSKVSVSFHSKMVATTIRVDCVDLSCGFVDLVKPESANPPLPEGSRHEGISRNCDKAINILYVLSFLSKGDGGTEAAHLLGLLGLPNSTTMGGSSFGAIEKQIGPTVLQKIADELVYGRHLSESVRLFYKEDVYSDPTSDFDGVSLFQLWQEGKLNERKELWPRLTVSADMGWQGRASGNSFNSMSGDAVLVDAATRKPVAWFVTSRGCSFCSGWKRSKKKDDPVGDH